MIRDFLSRLSLRSGGARQLGSMLFNRPWAIRPEALDSMQQLAIAFAGNGGLGALSETEVVAAFREAHGDDFRGRASALDIDGAEPVGERGMALVGSVMVIPIRGSMARRETSIDQLYGVTSYECTRRNVEDALDDARMKSILFDIDSPGGMVDGCFDLVDDLLELRGEVPMAAIANGMATSGAYALGMTVDQGRFFVTRVGEVGSIGVISRIMDCRAFMEREGITPITIKTGWKKDLGSPFREHDEEAIAELHAQQEDVFAQFLASVERARGLQPDAVRALEAGVFVGARGAEHGLIDGVSTLEALIEEMNESPAASAATVTAKGENAMGFKRGRKAVNGSQVGAPRAADDDEEDDLMEEETPDEELEDEAPDEEDEAEGEEDDEEMSAAPARRRAARGKKRSASTIVAQERARITAINDKAAKLGIAPTDPMVQSLIASGAGKAEAFESLIDIAAERGAVGRPSDPIASMRNGAPPKIGASSGNAPSGGGDDLESLVSAEMESAKQSGIVMSRAKAMRKVASSHPDVWRQANAKMHEDIGSLANNPNVRIVA